MAENKSASEGKASEAKDQQLTYEHDRLIAESHEFFDEPAHVVAGALEGEKKNLSRDEARKAINRFLSREVSADEEE